MKSDKPFKMHLFVLATEEKTKPLAQLLQEIDGLDLKNRVVKIGLQPYRIETVKPPTGNQPYWLVDFTKLRFNDGPGKASEATPVEGIDLNADQGFAEETAMLFDPTSKAVAVQYNHHGPRASAMATYFTNFDLASANLYTFEPRLTTSAQARLAKKTIFTKLKLRVAPALLTDKFRLQNTAMVTALEATSKAFVADYVTIEVGVERSSRFGLTVKKWLGALGNMASEEGDAVSTLRISGKDDDESSIDVIDLIKERVEYRIDGMPLGAADRRIPQADRFKALERAYKDWKDQDLIE